jgi:hypothetical protein
MVAMAIVGFLFSCNKKDITQKSKEEKEEAGYFKPFLNQYLICDSTQNISDGYTLTTHLGKGRGLDLQFGERTYLQFGNELMVHQYLLSQDTLYYAPLPQPLDKTRYFTFTTFGNIITLSKKTGTGTDLYFYHIE